MNLLLKHGRHNLEPSDMTLSKRVKVLLNLLMNYKDNIVDVVVPALKLIPNISDTVN